MRVLARWSCWLLQVPLVLLVKAAVSLVPLGLLVLVAVPLVILGLDEERLPRVAAIPGSTKARLSCQLVGLL
jgi:hypothetical protein